MELGSVEGVKTEVSNTAFLVLETELFMIFCRQTDIR